ncbi:mitochondrial Rho GTPase 1 [Hordeum vulgare]|nr:mitochondrial Rho GTPase 1 [Hordeum vulgare]
MRDEKLRITQLDARSDQEASPDPSEPSAPSSPSPPPPPPTAPSALCHHLWPPLPGCPGVRVIVIGDPGTGKSSLVAAVTTYQFPENVPKVMSHSRLPTDYFLYCVPITIVDSSSKSSPYPIPSCPIPPHI